MFMGSRNAPYPAFDAIMESWGGHNNGTTSNDRTNYYEIGPRNLLETFLWLEADRLATLPEVITEEELERQRKVVQNERRQSYENRPYGRAELAIPEAMYPAGASVPLADDRIARGSGGGDGRRRARVLRAVLPAVERQPGDRAATSIRPRRATLVEKLLRLAAAAAAARRARRSRPSRGWRATSSIALTDRVQLPRLRLSWHSPALFAPGDADLDMAAHVLGGGKSSRLYKALVFEQRIAQDVFAYQGSQMLGSLFQVGATAKPGHDLDGDRRRRRRGDRPSGRGRSDGRRAGARAQHAPGRLLQGPRPPADARRSAQPLPARARQSGRRRARRRTLRAGDDRVGARRVRARRRRQAPGPARHARAGRCRDRERTGGDGLSETPAAMAQAPAVGPLPAVALPRATRFSLLAAGCEVVACGVTWRRSSRRRSCSAAARACDPAGRTGLASIDRRDAGRGRGRARRAGHRGGAGAAGRRSVAGERARRLAAVDAGAARDVPRGDGDRRRRPDPAAAGDDRLAARARRPAHGRSCSGAISPRRSSTWSPIASLFGDAHPYGQPVDGLERTIDAITLDDVRAFHARPLPAEPRVAGRRGRLRRGDAAGGAGERRWPPGSRGRRRPPRRPTPWPSRPRLVLVDRPGAPAERRAAGRARASNRLLARSARAVDAERDPGRQLHQPPQLQPAREARLSPTAPRRASRSCATPAASRRAPRCSSSRPAPAVREMLSELRGLRERPITTEEHAKARATLLMRVAEGLASTGGMAIDVRRAGPLRPAAGRADALRRRPRAHDRRRSARARRALRRSRGGSIVIVGDRAAIEPGLRELGLPAPVIVRRRRRPAVVGASDTSATYAAEPRSQAGGCVWSVRRSFWRARSRRVPTVERGIVSLSAISS